MSAAQISVFPNVPTLQEAAAEYVAELLRAASAATPVRIALSGGSTPRRLHELLTGVPGVDWGHVHIFFGDERTVGPEDAQSNYRMARETLLEQVSIPAENVHRMRGEDDPAAAAAAYAGELREAFGLTAGEWPAFDLIILGMGPDGHTASLFPGTTALDEQTALAVANEVPQQSTWRITLTYPVLNAAQRILFLVAGADKADAINRVFNATRNDPPPAAFVRPTSGALLWYLDAAAAAGLPEG